MGQRHQRRSHPSPPRSGGRLGKPSSPRVGLRQTKAAHAYSQRPVQHRQYISNPESDIAGHHEEPNALHHRGRALGSEGKENRGRQTQYRQSLTRPRAHCLSRNHYAGSTPPIHVRSRWFNTTCPRATKLVQHCRYISNPGSGATGPRPTPCP